MLSKLDSSFKNPVVLFFVRVLLYLSVDINYTSLGRCPRTSQTLAGKNVLFEKARLREQIFNFCMIDCATVTKPNEFRIEKAIICKFLMCFWSLAEPVLQLGMIV